jgi:hypothetical protein
MALPFLVESTPGAYGLKAGNAALPISTDYGTIPSLNSEHIGLGHPSGRWKSPSQVIDTIVLLRRLVGALSRLTVRMQDALIHSCGRDAPETAQRKRKKQQRHTEHGKELGPDHVDARATQ